MAHHIELDYGDHHSLGKQHPLTCECQWHTISSLITVITTHSANNISHGVSMAHHIERYGDTITRQTTSSHMECRHTISTCYGDHHHSANNILSHVVNGGNHPHMSLITVITNHSSHECTTNRCGKHPLTCDSMHTISSLITVITNHSANNILSHLDYGDHQSLGKQHPLTCECQWHTISSLITVITNHSANNILSHVSVNGTPYRACSAVSFHLNQLILHHCPFRSDEPCPIQHNDL
ncbi:hypothetical protein J6590_055647 [Homalodisca vitripennis]|nr:hypothetical protein J6590_055647 [Homalodisca vitripennis]